MSLPTNPHDHFFKALLSDEDRASDFIRHYLPAPVVALLDLGSLRQEEGSFVDPQLQEVFTDLLFRVNLRDGKGAFVYLLFEHKSYPEPMAAYQVLRYLVRIWEHTLRQEGRLCPILPVVVYHGRVSWAAPCSLRELMGAPEEFEEYLPDSRYWLCDLTRYSDEEIRGAAMLQAGLLTLKYIFRPELGERLPDILGLLRALAGQRTGLEYLETLLRYLVVAGGNLSLQDLQNAVADSVPDREDVMSTIAETWIREGVKRGREEGLAQGLLEAIELGLELRFGPEGLLLLPEIAKAQDVHVLKAVRERLRTVESTDELRRFYHELTAPR